jgi:ribonuclease HII
MDPLVVDVTSDRTSGRKLKPSAPYVEESALIQQGYTLIAGLDEVGRGPLAGPVVAGVVILPTNPTGDWLAGIRDSKQLTAAQREDASGRIITNALGCATGIVSAEEIDEIGIVTATNLAMERALNSLPLLPQFLLLDAFPLPNVDIPQKAIVKGDSKSLSIAAASIVAKVTRDSLMVEMDDLYPGYGFAGHKGYGSADHIRRIKEVGPCPIHRYSFAPIRTSGHTR